MRRRSSCGASPGVKTIVSPSTARRLGEQPVRERVERGVGVAQVIGGGRDSGGIEPRRVGQQAARGGAAESGVGVGRIERGDEARSGHHAASSALRQPSSGRSSSVGDPSTSGRDGRMPLSPDRPAPRASRISTVSAWSSA